MIKQFLKYSKIPFVIGIREYASFYHGKADMIPFGKLGRKACHNVSQAVFLLDLGIEYCDKLLPCRKGPHVTVSLISFYSFFKLISRIKFQEFREYGAELVHGLFLLVGIGFWQTPLFNKQGLQAMPF
jgi:hypothetical protein